MIAPSRLRGSKRENFGSSENTVSSSDKNVGCRKCEKGCKLCNLFLEPTKYAWSYHTSEKFEIKNKINCNTECVIYVIHDTVCKKSYTGTTVLGMKERWRNHKSHIRNSVKSCELSTHFFTHENTEHQFDRKAPLKTFDETLSKQLKVNIIDIVDTVSPEDNTEAKLHQCKIREEEWQTKLKTLSSWGGMNRRAATVELRRD